MSKFTPIICVDFDGVIHSYTSGWKGHHRVDDQPVPGAIEFLIKHLPRPLPNGKIGGDTEHHEGPIVCIYSSRSKEMGGIVTMQEWLIKHGLPKAYIDDDILTFPTQKPSAFLTLDDRAICFNGKFPTTEEMTGFKPWNKIKHDLYRNTEHGYIVKKIDSFFATIGNELVRCVKIENEQGVIFVRDQNSFNRFYEKVSE